MPTMNEETFGLGRLWRTVVFVIYRNKTVKMKFD